MGKADPLLRSEDAIAVLVVDDDPGYQHTYTSILEYDAVSRDREYDIRFYRRPAEALADYSTIAPGLVIFDTHIAGMRRGDIVEQIRERDRIVPIILTGYRTKGGSAYISDPAHVATIDKPLDVKKFLDILGRSLY
jgi:DNA-binding NtrC family response regulator